MATDPQSLLNGAACYNNYSAQSWLLKLGLLKQILLNQNPMAATDPQSLLSSAQCYNCYGPGVWPLLELELLSQIATGGGIATLNSFTSGLIAPPASAAVVSVAHGLGATPKIVRVVLRCTSNDAGSGLVSGQEINVEAIYNTFSAANGNSVYADAVNVYWANATFYVGNQSSISLSKTDASGYVTITSVNNFSIRFYAIAF